MADYGRGAKAGALAGIILGIILAIGYYLVFIAISDTIKTALQSTNLGSSTIDAIYTATMIFFLGATFAGSVITGIILGLVFAAVESKYMKSKSLPMRG